MEASVSLVRRNRALELPPLERAERIANVRGFASRVIQRLDDVEIAGGPDGAGAKTFVDALREAADELVDAPAWITVGLARHRENPDQVDVQTSDDVHWLLEEALASIARAHHLLRKAVDRLEP